MKTDMTTDQSSNRVFVPFCDDLAVEIAGIGELVPYQLEYQCLRLKNGIYEFGPSDLTADQQAA